MLNYLLFKYSGFYDNFKLTITSSEYNVLHDLPSCILQLIQLLLNLYSSVTPASCNVASYLSVLINKVNVSIPICVKCKPLVTKKHVGNIGMNE